MCLLLAFVVVLDCMFTTSGTEVMACNFTANGHLYGLSTSAMSMNNSKTACAALNGELASFNTNTEYFTALKILTTDQTAKATKDVWVSFKVVSIAKQQFSWNSEQFNTSVWASGEPNENCSKTTTSECCARIEIPAGLRDRDCAIKYNFLCVFKPCPNGLQLDKGTCVDVDECSISPRVCQQNCTNTNGSFTCQCADGYRTSAVDKRNCTDIDECAKGTHGCQHNCTNTPGSFYCTCLPGYQIDKINNKTCHVIDECQVSNICNQTVKSHAYSNTTGQCPCPGVQNSTLVCSNSKPENVTDCPPQYLNTTASQDMPCQQGFVLNGSRCVDIDECQDEPRVCESVCSSECPKTCVNTPGSYTCACPAGYREVNGACVDVDECTDGHNCSQRCENTNGSYSCVCYHGYRTSSSDNTLCEDVNECARGSNVCEYNCTNTNGSYYCTCPSGYNLNTTTNRTCHDINECDFVPNACEFTCVNKINCPILCTNIIGSYNCSCPPGYVTVNTKCVDIDECAAGHNCSHMCQNIDGSYTCYCRSGFQVSHTDNTQCDDINECLDDHNDCDHNCVNTNGSYYCTCRTGYHLDTADNKTCHDINECDNTTFCQHHCHNTPGSYFCACPDGLQTGPDGHSCVRKSSFNMCPCRCGAKSLTLTYTQMEQAVEAIKKDLTVEKRDLSSYTRLKTCAEDTRQTAETVGYCGVVFMTAVACFIVLPDLFTVGCVLLRMLRLFP